MLEVTYISGATQYSEDIGYTTNGSVNLTRLQQIASGASGGTIYCSKIYNQIGTPSGFTYTQTTIANMPLVASGGTVFTTTGGTFALRVVKDATPTTSNLQTMTINNNIGVTSPWVIFTSFSTIGAGNGTRNLLTFDSSGNRRLSIVNNATYRIQARFSSLGNLTLGATELPTINGSNIISIRNSPSFDQTLFLNNVYTTSLVDSQDIAGSTPHCLFAQNSTSTSTAFEGFFQEYFILNSSLNNGQVSTITNTMNNYYQAY